MIAPFWPDSPGKQGHGWQSGWTPPATVDPVRQFAANSHPYGLDYRTPRRDGGETHTSDDRKIQESDRVPRGYSVIRAPLITPTSPSWSEPLSTASAAERSTSAASVGFSITLVLGLSAPEFQLVFYFFEAWRLLSGASLQFETAAKLGVQTRFGYSTDFKLGDSGFNAAHVHAGPEPSRSTACRPEATRGFFFRQLAKSAPSFKLV